MLMFRYPPCIPSPRSLLAYPQDKILNMNTSKDGSTRQNGEVVLGDLEYDGRVILYIIKGFVVFIHPHHYSHAFPVSDVAFFSRRDLLHQLYQTSDLRRRAQLPARPFRDRYPCRVVLRHPSGAHGAVFERSRSRDWPRCNRL